MAIGLGMLYFNIFHFKFSTLGVMYKWAKITSHFTINNWTLTLDSNIVAKFSDLLVDRYSNEAT